MMAHYNRVSDEQREKVIGLAMAGHPPMVIARWPEVTVGIDAIYTILAKARAYGRDVPRFPPRRPQSDTRPGLVVRVALWREEHVTAVARAAARRNITRSQLVNRMIEAALTAGLIDAVLDDEVADAP